MQAASSTEPLLRFERVSLVFDEAPVLDEVSFEVAANETCIILGAAGSGKTVLLKTVLGLLRPTSGAVFAFGQEITSMEEEELFDVRSRMGVLFQEGGLFDSLTIEENVSYPLLNERRGRKPPPHEVIRQKVEEALSFVELGHTLGKFPSELSGGMRRRVGIARAVVTEPPLVLYDSPTAGLDPITSYTIMRLIAKEREVHNATTVIVTHRYQDGDLLANFRYNPNSGYLDLARGKGQGNGNGSGNGLRTRFVVLREGRVVFNGRQEELEASGDPYISKFVNRRSDE
jgi:phospholipid/cholesterol/gamma-HCH transport system ATP-binding protein